MGTLPVGGGGLEGEQDATTSATARRIIPTNAHPRRHRQRDEVTAGRWPESVTLSDAPSRTDSDSPSSIVGSSIGPAERHR